MKRVLSTEPPIKSRTGLGTSAWLIPKTPESDAAQRDAEFVDHFGDPSGGHSRRLVKALPGSDHAGSTSGPLGGERRSFQSVDAGRNSLGIVTLPNPVRLSAPAGDAVAYRGTDASFNAQCLVSRYRPLLRLAARMDSAYVKQAHGKTLAGVYRGIQRDLLREYLRDLWIDLNGIFAVLTASSVRNRGDDGGALLEITEQRTRFVFLIWAIEVRLFLDAVMPGTLDIKPLVSAIEALVTQTQSASRLQLSLHVS